MEKTLNNSGLAYFWNQIVTRFSPKNHTHEVATSATSGMLSSGDKNKLDDITYKLGVDENGPYIQGL